MTSPNRAHRFAPLPRSLKDRALAHTRQARAGRAHRTAEWADTLRVLGHPCPDSLFGVPVTGPGGRTTDPLTEWTRT